MAVCSQEGKISNGVADYALRELESHVLVVVCSSALRKVTGKTLLCLFVGAVVFVVSGCSGGFVDVREATPVDESSRKNCRERLMLRRSCVRCVAEIGLFSVSSSLSLSLSVELCDRLGVWLFVRVFS